MRNIEDYKRGIKPLFRTGKRGGEVTNWVFEVSSEVRDALIEKGKIGIGWRICRVVDYVATTRCYKCQQFGHVSKYCKATQDTCGHCGELGHKMSESPNKNRKPTCHACKVSKKPHEHRIGEDGCLAIKGYLERMTRSITMTT